MLVVDLGQSGSRVRLDGQQIDSDRGKLNGESVVESLRAIFQKLPKSQVDIAALACTGFNGIVSDPQPFLALCDEIFGAKKVALIDDGLAGFVGALGGSNGVVLSIGGGVVSVGGNNSHFAHRDGLGSTFGDEGGGFWLGKLGLTRALGIRQGRGDDQILLTAFKDQVIEFTNKKGDTVKYNHDKVYEIMKSKLTTLPCWTKYKSYTATNNIPMVCRDKELV